MSRAVSWSTDALADLAAQVSYIATDNPSAALRVANTIDKTALALGDMPSGRPGRVTGTYEKSVTGLPYILAYVLTQVGGADAVAIVRVIHTSRHWPAGTWPE